MPIVVSDDEEEEQVGLNISERRTRKPVFSQKSNERLAKLEKLMSRRKTKNNSHSVNRIQSGEEDFVDAKDTLGISDEDIEKQEEPCKKKVFDKKSLQSSLTSSSLKADSVGTILENICSTDEDFPLPVRRISKRCIDIDDQSLDEDTIKQRRAKVNPQSSASRSSIVSDDEDFGKKKKIISLIELSESDSELEASAELKQESLNESRRKMHAEKLKRLQRRRSGNYSSDEKEMVKRITSTCRVLRSMATEPDILELPDESDTPSDESVIVEKKRKSKHKRKSRKYSPEESDAIESNIEELYNTEDEWEDENAGDLLYCNICEQFFNRDNFSSDQQKYGGNSRYCLLHSYAGGRIKAMDYNEELDRIVASNKRNLRSMESMYDSGEQSAGEYEEDDFIVNDEDEDD